MEVWDKSHEELADTGEARFFFMDMQMAIELEKIIPKKLTVDYEKKLNEASKLKRTVMGRQLLGCLLYTSPSPRDQRGSRMPSSA